MVHLEWFGQAMFKLTSPGGVGVLFDPMGPQVGYPLPARVPGVQVVLVSHEHFDHNNVALAGGPAGMTVVRGLAGGRAQRVSGSQGDVRWHSLPSYHDAQQGRQRGENAIFVVETGGRRLAHLGDLGHVLEAAAAQAIGPLDLLLIPVGGHFTIDAAQATTVVGQLRPKWTVPMHYGTPRTARLPIAPVDAFLMGKQVQRISGRTLTLDGPQPAPPPGTVIVLEHP